MKAIIFDLDNTLINWQDNFINALISVLKELHYDYDIAKIKQIDSAIDEVEKNFLSLKKEAFLDFINKKCNTTFTLEFVDKLIIAQKELYYEDKNLEDVLSYLSKKYDLYIITNWFTETQVGRCKKMHIDKYFKDIIGADINYFKPNPKAFAIILNKYKPSNCISVGDSLENDVILPLSLGMDAYLLTDKELKDYKTIKSLEELKHIL